MKSFATSGAGIRPPGRSVNRRQNERFHPSTFDWRLYAMQIAPGINALGQP